MMLAAMLVVLLLFTLLGMEIAWAIALSCFFYIGLSQLTGPAESVAQEAVGLDVLEVRYDPLRGATLVAGRYVDPQLYVGFRSPLDYNQNTSTNTSNSTVNSTAFEVEYAISRWLVFNLQGESSKVRSFFRARRAY